MPKRIIFLFLVFCSFTGCKWSQRNNDEGSPKIQGDTIHFNKQAPQLNYISFEKAQARQSGDLNLYGRIVWNDDVTVKIFSPVSGRVRSIAVKGGETLHKGDLLATLDSPDFGQTQADTKKAQSDFVLSEKNYQRQKELFAHGATPRKNLEAAEAEYQKALAENKRANAKLNLYWGKSGNVDDLFQLRTPLSGTLVEKNITPGQEVRSDQILGSTPSAGTPLFIVSDPKHLWILLEVNEAYLPMMKVGDKLLIHSKTYPDKSFNGQLGFLGNSLDPSTRTIRARGSVDNPDELLKAEMYVSVDLVTDSRPPGVEVSAKAVFEVGQKHYVFVEQEEGKFTRVEIQIGQEHDGKIPILEGLQEGQSIVTAGALLLEEMMEAKTR